MNLLNLENTNMNKEFIPYEQALELKELGFDEPCMFPYHRNNTEYIDSSHIELANYNATEKLVSAVLYQQAFRWFREKYNLASYIEAVKIAYEDGYLYKPEIPKSDVFFEKYINSYEEAELACLKKLIEIVSSKK